MKKKHSDFPWFLIYTPVITVIIMLWYWNIQTGAGSMDILEKILGWLGMNDTMVGNIVIIAIAVTALCYTIGKLFSVNKAARDIKKVADTAPDNITEYVDSKHEALSQSISNANDNICNTIREDKLQLVKDLTSIKDNVGFLTTQRLTVPVQQSQLLSEITSLYELHDRDQATINSQKETIDLLDAQNAALKQQNAYLQQKLDELTPKYEQTLSL